MGLIETLAASHLGVCYILLYNQAVPEELSCLVEMLTVLLGVSRSLYKPGKGWMEFFSFGKHPLRRRLLQRKSCRTGYLPSSDLQTLSVDRATELIIIQLFRK